MYEWTRSSMIRFYNVYNNSELTLVETTRKCNYESFKYQLSNNNISKYKHHISNYKQIAFYSLIYSHRIN